MVITSIFLDSVVLSCQPVHDYSMDLNVSCSRWRVIKKTNPVCEIVKDGLAMKVHCQNSSLLRYNMRKIRVYKHPGNVDGDAFDLVGMNIEWLGHSSLLVKIEKLEILNLTIMGVIHQFLLFTGDVSYLDYIYLCCIWVIG